VFHMLPHLNILCTSSVKMILHYFCFDSILNSSVNAKVNDFLCAIRKRSIVSELNLGTMLYSNYTACHEQL